MTRTSGSNGGFSRAEAKRHLAYLGVVTSGIDGGVVSSEWKTIPSISRLLLNGTGTVSIDSRDAAGAVTPAVYTTTLSSAVNVIEFPFYGTAALQIRATITGSATVKVI